MHIYIRTCICILTFTNLRTYINACIYKYVNALYEYLYKCIYIYTCKCIDLHIIMVYTYIYVLVYMHIRVLLTYIYMCIRLHIHMHMCISICYFHWSPLTRCPVCIYLSNMYREREICIYLSSGAFIYMQIFTHMYTYYCICSYIFFWRYIYSWFLYTYKGTNDGKELKVAIRALYALLYVFI
jgi:hypothetical protein